MTYCIKIPRNELSMIISAFLLPFHTLLQVNIFLLVATGLTFFHPLNTYVHHLCPSYRQRNYSEYTPAANYDQPDDDMKEMTRFAHGVDH